MLAPHILWLFKNNFETISYAFDRTGIESKNISDHFLNPIYFLFKQLGIMLFFSYLFLMVSIKKKKVSI